MVQVGYILRSFPRLSQTFILNEILALEQLGVELQIFAITDPHEPVVQPEVAQVRAPIHYLEAAQRQDAATRHSAHLALLRAAPQRYKAALRYVRQRPELDEGYTASSRFVCFDQAVYLASLIARDGGRVRHLHAHFAHDPTLIALLTEMLTGIPFSFTAHARDLFQIPPATLLERIAAGGALVTCCGANLRYLDELLPQALRAKVRLIYHGVDLGRFQPRTSTHDDTQPPLILSIGRLVEKKGFGDLLRACGQLKRAGQRFRLAIYGDGPLHGALTALIAELGLHEEVTLPGAVTQQQLLPALQQADLFALTPFVTADGDSDGVPNVLVEAMACGLPVVSTAVAGVPELVVHAHNGLLAPPQDVAAITAALTALLDDAPTRQRMGSAARQTVIERFDLRAGAQQIAALFAAE